MIAKRQLLTLGAGIAAAIAGVWLANRQGKGLGTSPGGAQPKSLDALWSLTLPTPSGEELALVAFKGKPLLINFWATWCAPCVEELPLLEQFYQQNTRNGIQLLGIAADKAASVTSFLIRLPISFPIVLAGFEGISISKQLGNETGGLPHTILIGTKGGILFAKKGQLTTNDIKTMEGLIL